VRLGSDVLVRCAGGTTSPFPSPEGLADFRFGSGAFTPLWQAATSGGQLGPFTPPGFPPVPQATNAVDLIEAAGRRAIAVGQDYTNANGLAGFVQIIIP